MDLKSIGFGKKMKFFSTFRQSCGEQLAVNSLAPIKTGDRKVPAAYLLKFLETESRALKCIPACRRQGFN